MKSYKITITNTVLDEKKTVELEAANPQDAHKEALFNSIGEFDEITEIRSDRDILVYGPDGFVNALRDLEG